MHVKFSFIIPTRNEEEYIGDCLKSIRNQNRKDYEIIVADTLSSDDTRKIARRYADKVIIEKQRGPSAGRNAGAHAARGDILVFADADVRFERDFLDKLDLEFSNHSLTVGCIFSLRTYDAPSALIARSYDVVNWIAKTLNSVGITITAGSCFAYRRRIFEKTSGFNLRLLTNEDHDMANRAAKFGRFAYFDISVSTSVRRVAKNGFFGMILTYVKSTLIYALNKSCVRDYWER